MVPAAERSHSAGVTSKLTFPKSQRELVSPCLRPYRRGKIIRKFPLGSLSSCGSTPCLVSCRSETPSPLREKWKVQTGPGREEGGTERSRTAHVRSSVLPCLQISSKQFMGCGFVCFLQALGLVPSLGVRDEILFNYLKMNFKAISAYHGPLKT